MAYVSLNNKVAQAPAPGAQLPQIKETGGWGKLIGRVVAVWLRPGDPGWDPTKQEWQMRLMEPFAYEDEKGIRWDAPAGSPIDGASIPKVIWSALAGTPYTGHYREASVVHDRYCDVPANHSFRQIARMFYGAMRCEGTGVFEAAIKYYAVLKFGPQDPHTKPPARIPRTIRQQSKNVQELNFRALIDEAGPRMNDDELATFYKSLQESRPSGKKEPTSFVVPDDKIKGAQDLWFKREGAALEDKRHMQFKRSGMDFTESATTEQLYSRPLTMPITRAAVTATDKESEEFWRTVKYLADKASTITPEEIESIADNGVPTNQ